LNIGRTWKSLVYPWIPSISPAAHAKRRKGLFYRGCRPDVLECQKEQDRIFWRQFLHPEKSGKFLEVGGDGVIGSHTLGLELLHGWTGTVCVQRGRPEKAARQARRCNVLDAVKASPVSGPMDLLAVHQLPESRKVLESLKGTGPLPLWVIVENREPDPHWCRLLERLGYKMRFFFHDDEYYELQS